MTLSSLQTCAFEDVSYQGAFLSTVHHVFTLPFFATRCKCYKYVNLNQVQAYQLKRTVGSEIRCQYDGI